MPFKFVWLVQLFEALEAARKTKALTTSRPIDIDAQVTAKWFDDHDHKLERTGPSAIAFLSCMLPERLPERSYGVREDTLVKIFCRVFSFGHTRASELRRWRERNVDFATTVEHAMANSQSYLITPSKLVTLEEIDQALLRLGANSQAADEPSDEVLKPILRNLTPEQAKWLVRMILKSYKPIQIPEATILKRFHFLLPELLTVQNSFDAAVAILGHDNIKILPYNPVGKSCDVYLALCAEHIRPKLGVMITRTKYEKARSIKHCYNMARQRLMSVERKYDGEYCQVHIDRSKGKDCIQIFSKSGRDSTYDRERLRGAIEAGLRLELDRQDCAIDRNCIVDGELVVYSRTQKTILPFHKIRKHVMHGGRYIGIDADSPRRGDEQLMIIFYDILLLDDKVLSKQPHCERRKELERIVRHVEGEAELAYRQVINFGSGDAKGELREFFTHAILQRWEGLVLKGCHDPYFSWESSKRVIKLKKDYIRHLGDTVDLCIVGGRRDQSDVDELGIGPLSWTTFYIACIENKEQVHRFKAKPVFRILDTVSIHGISNNNIRHLNDLGQFMQTPFANFTEYMDVEVDRKVVQIPTVLFKKPLVVEIMGAGFDRPQNAAYYVLRFPRLVKLHRDRNILDTSTFEELQEQAQKSMQVPLDDDEKREVEWIEGLIAADGRDSVNEDLSQTTASPVQSTPGGFMGRHMRNMAGLSKTAPPTAVNVDHHSMATLSTTQACANVGKNAQTIASPVPVTPGAGPYQHSQSTMTPDTTSTAYVHKQDETPTKRVPGAGLRDSQSTVTPSPSALEAIIRSHAGRTQTPSKVEHDVIVIDSQSTTSPSKQSPGVQAPNRKGGLEWGPYEWNDVEVAALASTDRDGAVADASTEDQLGPGEPSNPTQAHKRKYSEPVALLQEGSGRKRRKMASRPGERPRRQGPTPRSHFYTQQARTASTSSRMPSAHDHEQGTFGSSYAGPSNPAGPAHMQQGSFFLDQETLADQRLMMMRKHSRTTNQNDCVGPPLPDMPAFEPPAVFRSTKIPTSLNGSVLPPRSQTQPFEPPAVFRSSRNPTSLMPPPKSTNPLAQGSTMSPPRGHKRSRAAVVSADESDKENEDRQYTPSNRPASGNVLGLRGGSANQKVQSDSNRLVKRVRRNKTNSPSGGCSLARETVEAQYPPPKPEGQVAVKSAAKTCPPLQLSRDDFAEKVLCPKAFGVDCRNPPNMPQCPTHRGLLVRLVDKSSPLATVEEIRNLGRDVLNMRRVLLRARSGQARDEARKEDRPQRKKLVMFYDSKITNLVTDYDCDWRQERGFHSKECGILRKRDLVSRFFAGALLFTTSGEFCTSKMHAKYQGRQSGKSGSGVSDETAEKCDEKGFERDASAREHSTKHLMQDFEETLTEECEDMKVEAMWDWTEAMDQIMSP